MKLSECLPNVLHAETIEKNAVNLLNRPKSLTQVTAEKEKCYLAAARSTGETFKITISAKSLVKYSCKGFRYSNMCSQSVAVSEKKEILNNHIAKFKSCRFRASIIYAIKPGSEGSKRGQKRRQRLYEEKKSCAQENLQPFTETLILTQVKDVPIDKNICAYCQNEFPRGHLAIVPFDIVISHKKRQLYLNRSRNADSQSLYIASSVKKLTNKYYYIRRKCIYNRFPYFTAQLLKVKDGTILTKSHKKIIKDQLDVPI